MKQLFNYTVLRWKAFIIAWLQVGLDKLFLSLNVGVTLPVLQARAELQTLKHFWTCFVAYYLDLFLPLTQFQVYFNHLDPYMLSSNGNSFLWSGDQNWWIRTPVIQNPPTWFSPVST